MDQVSGATSMRDERGTASASPIEDFLIDLHQRVSDVGGGKVADYIPELGKADAESSAWPRHGRRRDLRDRRRRSPLHHPVGLEAVHVRPRARSDYGRDAVLRHVGVEPTGEAFNSIVLDEVANRPFNPMVNAGAIAVAALIRATRPRRASPPCSMHVLRPSPAAGSKSTRRCSTPRSASGHRNRAIAYMMLNSGMIERDPIEALDLYFRQCSITRHLPRPRHDGGDARQ